MKKKFFDLAKKLAIKSSHHAHKLGCVIVRNNKVVSVGWNQLKTHPKSTHPFKTLHAEMHAVLNQNMDDFKSAEAYIYRETKHGELALSRPCQYCEQALHHVGIKMIHYTTIDGFNTEIMS